MFHIYENKKILVNKYIKIIKEREKIMYTKKCTKGIVKYYLLFF
jgi:hypothetical protein